MVAHYARLSDKTIRRHWERARKVNVSGEVVTLDPEGPLAEASWAKQRQIGWWPITPGSRIRRSDGTGSGPARSTSAGKSSPSILRDRSPRRPGRSSARSDGGPLRPALG